MKTLFKKLYSTLDCSSPINANLISYYFSLVNSSPNCKHLRHLHARLLRTSLYDNVVISSRLVLAYSQQNHLVPYSLSVFFHMPQRNIYSWNIIIGEFSRSNSPLKAIDLFLHMWQSSDVRPDDFTFPLVLRACVSSGLVKLALSFHGLCLKLGFERSLFVASAMVFMYVNFGKIFDARVLFDGMPKRDAVMWTAMLDGYAKHEEPTLGLALYREMIDAGVSPDWVVMLSLLLMCGLSGWLKHGKSVHGWCVRRSLGMELNLGNAIVDMYLKCAVLTYAHRVFNTMNQRDVISWSSLILGHGLSGDVRTAFELFQNMIAEGVKPNEVTFLGILSACSHGGLAEKASLCFEMIGDYGVTPELKHYASMVDCLARAGLLEQAEEFVNGMPMEPDAAILGAILAGCRVHNNVEVGERIAKKLIGLEPEKCGYYVLLSNIYAATGKFDEAEKVRQVMRGKNVSKVPGCSSIESECWLSSSAKQ
ncbi:Pentatricopeptide repeat-containing protein [Hibiscus syriacus]|uniref:Pentatricopeptide repeat-containing protein n=1 Tax=Hibiscus syriacus TaxID=106335 RepID=A0A6A2XLX9_HIBSY|nr:pentatricopeptide repeat-containing protein At4g14170-like [Hibiscus syriacus]KAE8657467.1 Pentatricopeptide repeat-containing protein [Hibiscus syriacus]